MQITLTRRQQATMLAALNHWERDLECELDAAEMDHRDPIIPSCRNHILFSGCHCPMDGRFTADITPLSPTEIDVLYRQIAELPVCE